MMYAKGDRSMLLIRRKLGSTYNYIASLCRFPHASLGGLGTGCCEPNSPTR